MRRFPIYLVLALVIALAFACKKEENYNATSTTGTTETSTSATATTGTYTTTATTATTGTVSDHDKDFITDTGKAGKAEVDVAQDAVTHAADADVKAFAQKLVDDHIKANDELAKLAAGKGVTLPSEMEAKMKEAKERLMKLTGKSFDQAFIKQMVEDHTSLIKKFEDKSKESGVDADLKKFVDDTLPKLRDHLAKANELETKLGGEKKKS